ncbi:thyroid receptor-interacting protein 11 [Linepithema humile]|uniref:thyroid receptor-interacting protein 11 n=1 Tax=Linepithema humile TaxID=83485 RepID=UPI0006230BE3|nr:PREDICTED: thyroid receptor-interacting protein 11-like [Linepithema humile]
MSWFGDSLSSLSNLKGQITNLTRDVLSEGIVEEIDERSKALKEANERCSQLQDLLTTKDAEISLLRRQNCELQKTVIEINAKSKESKEHSDDSDGVFWDPSCVDNRNARSQNHVRQLQEQLAQATVKVRELECELKRIRKDDITDGHQKAEVVRAKQDMMNRIIQMEEKTREAERNAKHIQLDEASLIHDFRSVISKLNSREKFDLVSGALKALQIESETHEKIKDHEKLQNKSNDAIEELPSNKEEILQTRIEELKNENKDLSNAMEKLDEEHAQSIEKLLSLKEESNRKHHFLQDAYEQLSTDYNKVQKRTIELQAKLDENARAKSNCQSAQTDNVEKSDQYAQITLPSREDVTESSSINDIIEKVQIILKNHTISSIEPDETIFETIAKQYVDSKWKLDVLERRITEIIGNFKETEEVKFSLQEECDELQSHIDSLLLENQALVNQALANQAKSNLPSIPEASEERVAFLEMEVETLREEVKRLLAENERIRETDPISSAAQNKEASLINHNNSQEDTNRQAHSSRKNRELPVLLEKNEDSNEDGMLYEQLKLDHENVTRELEATVAEMKLLESNIASLQDTARALTEENEDLLEKNMHLDTRHNRLLQEREKEQEENSYLLNDLQKQLDRAALVKSDLENDISRKERELDKMLLEINGKQHELAKFNQDHEILKKENESLSKQLTATHNEFLDKIEFLNTEMSLLQQEHEDLKQEMSIYKDELSRTKEKLRQVQEHCTELENERHALKARCERLEVEKGDVQNRATEARKLENDPGLATSLTEGLSTLQNFFNFEFAGQKAEMLHAKETQPKQEDIANLSSANIDKINTKVQMEEQVSTAQDDLVRTTAKCVEEKQDLVSKETSATSNDNERQALESIIDEERRERDIIKAHKENLTREITQLRSELQTTFEIDKLAAEMARKTIEDLSHLLREKDEKMSVLQGEITRANNTIMQLSNELTIIRSQKNEFEQLISIKHNESLQYQNEMQRMVQHINEQGAHIERLIAEQTANEARDKANVEEQHSKSLQKSCNNDDQTADRTVQSGEIVNKKCDALEAALLQEQSNNRILQNQLTESQIKEANSAKELERLRTHLVEIESSYTEEALISERNREELEAKLLQAEEKVKSSSTAFTSANIRANQQVETLQQQIALITQQRDQIQAKLSAAEDNIMLQSASLTNLQIVLEQFQQDKERDVILATEKIRSQLNDSYRKQDELLKEISILKQQLSEAKECLQAASRLSEQLEKKDAQIERFNEEVARLTELLNFADQKVKEAAELDEGKVDKTLVKNLLLGYLSSATSDKSSILRVFANVLDFTELEKDKTGLNSLLRNNGSASSKDQEASLSTAFVRFLESESKPKPQLPALPIVNSSPRPGYNKQQSQSTSSAQSTLLLPNVTLPTFPDFIPARNTGSILKEVLKDS